MNFKRLVIPALLATVAAMPAQAANFIFHYEAFPDLIQNGAPVSATLFLTTADTLNTVGGYDILSATGTIDGNAVTGLVANPNQPDTYEEGGFSFDNVLFAGGGAFLDPNGFMVTTASAEYNFGYGIDLQGNPVDRYFSWIHTGASYASSAGSATLDAAVPEPASWAMMVAGFGLAGATMRRRRTAVRFA